MPRKDRNTNYARHKDNDAVAEFRDGWTWEKFSRRIGDWLEARESSRSPRVQAAEPLPPKKSSNPEQAKL